MGLPEVRFRPAFRINWLTGVPIKRVSILLGHQSVRITERHYTPWVRSRKEQLEADLTNAWGQDAFLVSQTQGTSEVHAKPRRIN